MKNYIVADTSGEKLQFQNVMQFRVEGGAVFIEGAGGSSNVLAVFPLTNIVGIIEVEAAKTAGIK